MSVRVFDPMELEQLIGALWVTIVICGLATYKVVRWWRRKHPRPAQEKISYSRRLSSRLQNDKAPSKRSERKDRQQRS